MTEPTRYPTGVTNAAKDSAMGMLPMLDPTKHIVFFDDFFGFTAADWTITTTELGTGSATEAMIEGLGGLLQITNAAGDNDNDFLQWTKEHFQIQSGKQAWFAARLKVSDATESDLVIGLQITDTTPLAVSDGIYFQKDDGDANLDFHVTADSSSTSETAVSTLADDTFAVLAFHWDGEDTVSVYKDNVRLARVTVSSTVLAALDDELLCVSLGIQNGTDAAKVLTLDYVLAILER